MERFGHDWQWKWHGNVIGSVGSGGLMVRQWQWVAGSGSEWWVVIEKENIVGNENRKGKPILISNFIDDLTDDLDPSASPSVN